MDADGRMKKKFTTRRPPAEAAEAVEAVEAEQRADEDEDDGFDTTRSIRQLWSTHMGDMRQVAASNSHVGQCVCCVRPVLIADIGTRKMTFCSVFVDILQKSSADKSTLLYNEQCRLLQEGHARKYILVCFICLPSWKKSITQQEAGRIVETPSLFMHKSSAFLYDSSQKTDKLSLLKYVLCTSSEVLVAETGAKKFHPMRNSDFVILEAIIVFFKGLFSKYDCNVRRFSRMFCHFQIVSIVRWHVAGFPLIMMQNRQTQDLRKALRGDVGRHYHELWGFASDFISIQNGSATADEHACEECAACAHRGDMLRVAPAHTMTDRGPCAAAQSALGAPRTKTARSKTKSYDSFFLKDWKYIHETIAHTGTVCGSKPPGIMQGNIILCRHHLMPSVVSYSFYHRISHRFPKKFRQRNVRRYYSRLLHDATPVDAKSTVIGSAVSRDMAHDAELLFCLANSTDR